MVATPGRLLQQLEAGNIHFDNLKRYENSSNQPNEAISEAQLRLFLLGFYCLILVIHRNKGHCLQANRHRYQKIAL